MTWDLSCTAWRERLRDGRPLVPDLPLDTAEADRAVAALNLLRLADVTGTPTFGEAGGDWFRRIVAALFGSVDRATGERWIRELFLLVPKKNSKTTNGALLMLVALMLNRRPYAPMLLTGPVQDTAETAYDAAAGAIELDPVLKAKLHTRDHLKKIQHRETKAELEIITFDPSIVTGKKVVAALIDEVHVLGKMPRADKALLQLRGGMQPFPEAFLVMATTQSDEAPAGVFADELTRAREVRDGKRVGKLLPVLYEFPEDVQQDKAQPWRDPALWPMVTPNAGKSISIPRLQQAYEDEVAKGEKALRIWASQHLNIQIGVALQYGGWAGAEFWERNAEPALSLDDLLKRSEVVTIGIDGGGLEDLLGFSVVGREIGTGAWLHWGCAWMHPIVLERRSGEASLYRDFERDGDLRIVSTVGQDVLECADIVEQVNESKLLGGIGLDPNGIGEVYEEIVVRRKIDESLIEGIRQGWSLVGAIKTAERMLAAEKFRHGGSRLMAWSVGNAKVEPRGNAVMITKQISGSAKIDPLMATLNAVQLMSKNSKSRVRKYQAFIAG